MEKRKGFGNRERNAGILEVKLGGFGNVAQGLNGVKVKQNAA